MCIRDSIYAGKWLSDYALAQSKLILGEARSKYMGGIPGAGGNIVLNGEAMKQEKCSIALLHRSRLGIEGFRLCRLNVAVVAECNRCHRYAVHP